MLKPKEWIVPIPCPSCKGQALADISKGTYTCKCGDYGKCGFR